MKKSIALLVLLLSFVLSGNVFAFSFLEDWTFDPDGLGTVAAVTVPDFLNVVGETTAINTYVNATDFTFTETASFEATGYGLPNVTFSPILDWFDNSGAKVTADFVGAGYGSLGSQLTFTSGTLDIYFEATNIAKFSLIDGYSAIDGQAVPNGVLTTIFEATYLAPDVFFDGALDLSTVDPQKFVLGFATTNATLTTSTFVGNVQTLELGNNGQYRLAVVPEPSTFLLLGGGLLGLGFCARRKKQ